MRKRHTVDLTINELVEYFNENQLDFDYPVQRPHDQWSHIDKSLLIHSVLSDYDIPAIYAVNGIKEDSAYSIIDGKQRLSILADFLNDKLELHVDTPQAHYKGSTHDIAQYKFSELHELLQNAIKNYTLRMIYFVNISDDEIFEMFYRLNNGKGLSRQQKVKAKMGMDLALFMKELCDTDFIKDKIVLTNNQRKNSEYETIITQAIMLIDDSYSLKSFNAKDVANYTQLLKDKDEQFLDTIKATIEYVNNAYKGAKGDIELKKVNVPMLIATAHKVGGELSPEQFYEWTGFLVTEITKEDSPYREFVGKSTTNKGMVEGRYSFMLNHAKSFINVVSKKEASAV